MKLVEFASAEEQLALWRLVSDNVWAAISQQAKDEAEQKAQKQAQAKKQPKSKRKAMPPPPSVPTPPKAPIPKPNTQPYVRRAVSKPAMQVSVQPQQAIGVAKSIQPKMPANTQKLPNVQQASGVQKSGVTGRKIGFSAK